MARETIHVVQTYDRDPEGGLVAGQPVGVKSAAEARVRAVRVKSFHAGVVAFSRTGDLNIGEYEDAEIIAQFGDVPCEEAFQD